MSLIHYSRRRSILGLIALVALSASCAGDSSTGSASGNRAPRPDVPEAERSGGTVVVAGRNDIISANSLVTLDTESLQHQIHVLFVTLVRADEDYSPLPYLARSWSFNDDGSSITFELRDDLTWHDGEPVTARDVAFTFHRMRNPDTGYPNPAYFDAWEAVDVVDEYTVRFAVRQTAYPLYGWTRLAIMPEHILGDVPAADLATHPFGTTEPVGNGPFRFVERIPGDRWVFEANPDFPEELGGRPYVDRYVYRAISDDAALTASLRNGDVDMVLEPAPAELPRLAADTTLKLIEYGAPEYDFIAWNSRRPMFAEAEVRRALTMAIDRDALVTALLEGHGDVAVGPVGPWHWAFDGTDEPIPFSPDSARAAFSEAGWTDGDGDGIIERDGQDFEFELFAAPRDKWRDIATAVQANLRDVGIRMTIGIREPASIGPLVFSPDRRYDALLLGWSRDVPLDDRELWACERIEQPFQFTSYCNPALDAVLDSMQVVADRGLLDALVDRYNEIMAQDQPYTFLYYADHIVAARVELRDAAMDSRGDWVSIVDWWLEPAARSQRQ